MIATDFGALGDNTRYGYAVPPIDQPFWVARGFAALADLNGTLEALHKVHRGELADADRAAAVGEVHARPHLLIQAPRGILQLAFMTEGDQARDQMAMSELSHRFGVAEPDHATPLHGMTWDEGDLHCEKHTEFSTYLWCASLDSETGEPCGENPFKHGFVPPGPVVSGIRLRLLPWTPETEKEADRFDPASLCYSLVENGSAAILSLIHI